MTMTPRIEHERRAVETLGRLPKIGDVATLQVWGGGGYSVHTGIIEDINWEPGDWDNDPVVILDDEPDAAFFLSQVVKLVTEVRDPKVLLTRFLATLPTPHDERAGVIRAIEVLNAH